MKSTAKYFLFFILFPLGLFAQTNFDFESGLTGWTCETGCAPYASWYPVYWGDGYNNYGNNCTGGWVNSGAIAGRHTVIAPAGTAYCSPALSLTPPGGGGTGVLKLGNDAVYAYSERVSNSWTITENNCILTVKYAVVLQDGPYSAHGNAVEEAFFKLELLNGGSAIACPSGLDVHYSTPGTNWVQVGNYWGGAPCWAFLYQDWTTATFDLSGYVGQTITIRMTTGDCAVGGDACIAYVDMATSALPTTSAAIACAGNSTNLTAPNGSGWAWTPGGQATQAISVSTASTHTVTFNDVSGCPKREKFAVTVSSTLAASANPTANVLCNSALTGTAASSASGGAGGYTYLWSNGQTTANATGLGSGTHTVTITDANSCTQTATAVITQPTALAASASPTANVLCFGNSTGTASSSISGGTGSYTYSWSAGGQTTANATGLANGTHTVTVTDANGCTKTATASITQPAAALVASASPTTNVLCFGNLTGVAGSSAAGGTGSYTYSWSAGAQTTSSSTGLANGTYTVTITDANGCTDNETVSITQPAAGLVASASPTTNILCFGNSTGVAGSSGAGGTGTYTYLWSAGAQTTSSATGLTSGTYTVTITDANGCTDNETVSITQPVAALVASTSTTTNVLCFGNSTGVVGSSGAGGTGAYTYLWSAGAQTTSSATGLANGTYTVTITDANGCTDNETASITQPAAALAAAASATTNVLCFGNSTGVAGSSAAGGTGSYTYSWSAGAQTTSSATGLANGTYTVTITDANGCTSQTTANVTQPASDISLSLSPTNATCGASNGSISSTVSGGTSGYTYLWDNGITISGLTNVSAGAYTLTVTDLNGCTKQSSTVINNAGAPSTTLASSNNILCYGATTGEASINVSGGNGTYTYAWTGPNGFTATTEDISNLSEGTYVVTVNDANNCISGITVIITEPATLTANASIVSNVNCFGGNNGSADVAAGGGVTNYSYVWSAGGQTTATATGLTNGSYTITVTDNNGCTASDVVTITEPVSALTSAATVISHVDCNGNNTGSLNASANGGTASYGYSWNNGTLTAGLSNITAGTYTVTVTDNNGCTSQSSATINQPNILTGTIQAGSIANVNCFGTNTASVSTTVGGGTPNYSYAWSNGSSTAGLSGVAAGSYTVTITDANGCTSTDNVTFTQPTDITATASALDAACGQANGSTSSTVSGGTGTYTYLWSNGATTANLTNVLAGSYSYTVTDANNCTKIASTVVNNAGAPTTTLSTSSATNCNNDSTGSIDINVTGGNGTYTYTWTGPNGFSATSEDLSNLPAGTYVVTVNDASNCISGISVNITQPNPLMINVDNTTHVKCYGDSTGDITTFAFGGTPGISYSWNNGTTSNMINNLTGGTYTLTATDAKGCTKTQAVTILQPGASLVTTAVVNQHILCYGNSTGEISATTNGGTSTYDYSWSNGALGSSQSGLNAGTYIVTVTDNQSCKHADTVTINGPSVALGVTATGIDLLCNGDNSGTILASATGGTAGYSYSWLTIGDTTAAVDSLPIGTYTVIATDVNNCTITNTVSINQPNTILIDGVATNATCGVANGSVNIGTVTGGMQPFTYSWNTGDSTNIVNGLSAGNYVVTINDANNCSKTQSYSIANNPGPAIDNLTTIDVNCKGASTGTASAIVSGGSGTYTYSWSNGSQGGTISNLTAGVYQVIVNDINNCRDTAAITIQEPDSVLIISNITASGAICSANNGSATVTVSGGTPSYTYSWSNGWLTNSASNLQSGTYGIVITDANGCTINDNVTIAANSGSIVIDTLSFTSINCFGGSSNVSITVSYGTPTYTYNWSNGSNANSLNNISAGTYSVIVSDANGCADTANFTITEPSALLLTPSLSNVSCFGDSTGSASAIITGGTSNYTYSWSNGGTNSIANNLMAGLYSLIVTDANGCTSSHIYTISQPGSAISADIINYTNISCYGANTGSASVNSMGGTPTYSYSWSNNNSSNTINNLMAGAYHVIVTDANGCTAVDTITITQPIDSILINTTSIEVNCYGDRNGSVSANVVGGNGALNYVWSNGSTQSSATGLNGGTYTVTVIDANGCSSTKTATVYEPLSPPTASFSVDKIEGIAPVTITISNGSTGATTYSWNFGDSTSSIQQDPVGHIYENSGEYEIELTVLTDKGCKDIKKLLISVRDPFTINVPNVFTPNGDGINDAFYIPSTGLKDLKCTIYDRWGLLIYTLSAPKDTWDGRTQTGLLAPDGTYYYILDVDTYDNGPFNFQGYLQLIR